MVLKAIKRSKEADNMTPEAPTIKQLSDAEDLPGDRIRLYRNNAGMSQRALAEKCNPPMDFTAIGRIERNQGFTRSTLVRLAKALNCEVADFFLPAEVVAWKRLPDDMRQEITQTISRYCDAAGIE